MKSIKATSLSVVLNFWRWMQQRRGKPCAHSSSNRRQIRRGLGRLARIKPNYLIMEVVASQYGAGQILEIAQHELSVARHLLV